MWQDARLLSTSQIFSGKKGKQIVTIKTVSVLQLELVTSLFYEVHNKINCMLDLCMLGSIIKLEFGDYRGSKLDYFVSRLSFHAGGRSFFIIH